VHHVESEAERDSLLEAAVEPWAGGEREHFMRIVPTHITGRRIRRSGAARLPRRPGKPSTSTACPGQNVKTRRAGTRLASTSSKQA
jgi:hypothetical protein